MSSNTLEIRYSQNECPLAPLRGVLISRTPWCSGYSRTCKQLIKIVWCTWKVTYKEWGILKIIRFLRPRWEIRLLILKTPHSEGITLSKAQAKKKFFFFFLKLADTHQVSWEKMKKNEKKKRPCVMKGKMPTSRGLK